MSRLRIFIAVDAGTAIRERMVALQEALARTGVDVKWVEPGNLHVTLLFLGEVDERAVPEVCRCVSQCCETLPAFSLTIESTGCFPSIRRPRVLWVGVGQGAQELCSLHDALEQLLLELGCYRREERKYTPHVTLGRVKSDRRTDTLSAALAKQAGWKGGQIMVREVLVMSSKLTPNGPEYTVLSRGKLKG